MLKSLLTSGPSSDMSGRKEVPCLICGCQRQCTIQPKLPKKNLRLHSDYFCNLYGITSTIYRLDIESIFQNSRLCSQCHQEIAQVKILNSKIEILKRKIQTIKVDCDSKLKEFKVNSGTGAVGNFEIEAKENHEKLCNYVFHCSGSAPVTCTIPNSASGAPFWSTETAPNYQQFPGRDIQSLTFDFGEASGSGVDGPDKRNSNENTQQKNANSTAFRKNIASKGLLSVRADRAAQRRKQVNNATKRFRLKPKLKLNEIPKLKRQKKKLAREARLMRLPFACSYPGCPRRYSDELERDGHKKKCHEGISHPFACQSCNSTFQRYPDFKDHANVHAGLLTHICPEPGCAQKYATDRQLRGHTRRKHRNNAEIVCEHCGAACPSISQYEDHILRVHTQEPAFGCDICGKFFSLKASLQDHHRFTHPELIPELEANKCKYCKKKFVAKEDLEIHERRHTGTGTGLESPSRYKCDICQYATSLSYRFKMHMTRHSDVKTFACDVCQHLFKTQSHLNRHKTQYHPATKEFTCPDCGKSFTCKKYLTAHENIHKEVKSLACSLCERTFAQHTSLYYHMKNTHKIGAGADTGTGSGGISKNKVKHGTETEQVS